MRILTLVVMAHGFNASLLADGSALKRYYAQCGLSSHEINNRLAQWDKLSEIGISVDNCMEVIERLLPCKECNACLYESQKQVKRFFIKNLFNGLIGSDHFEKACKSFVFQQVKKSCGYHRRLFQRVRRDASRDYNKKTLKAYETRQMFDLINDKAFKNQSSSILQKVVTPQVLDPFKQHKKMFDRCLYDIKFLGFEKEYQACLAREERDVQEWQAMLDDERYKFFGVLLDMYISSEDPYILNSSTLECAFHLLSSKDFFEWAAKHCQELIESENEEEMCRIDGNFESINTCRKDDEVSLESCEDSIDFKEFLEWCEWILDNIDFIRADLDEYSFEHEDQFLYDDCLSSESELSDEDELDLEKSLEDEFSDVSPKSRGLRKYLNNQKWKKRHLKKY